MTKRRLTTAELEHQLREQLGTLRRAAKLFDDGYTFEALKMATVLRVMLHSGKWPSLLKQLGRDQIEFANTSVPYDPKNLLTTHSLISLRLDNNGSSYVPRLDGLGPPTWLAFPDWWGAVVFADMNKNLLTRSDIVRTAADQDGGAHVDEALRGDYASLRYDNSLGWIDGAGAGPNGDPTYAALRQITHEVLKTFIPNYSKTTEEVQAARRSSEISGGKLRFYPHQKIFFINQLKSPLKPGQTYRTEIVIDSMTTGAVMTVANTAASDPITSEGRHTIDLTALESPESGVFGMYTDAVIDQISIREILG